MDEHPNARRARESFEAFARGDLEALRDFLAEDVVWHQPGDNILSGDHKGRDSVLALFGRIRQETDGTFIGDVHDVIANDEHTVVLNEFTGERKGKQLKARGINVFHNDSEGRVTERWLFPEDTNALNDFWS